MFAGRKVHPFFSSWKESKKNREVIDVDGKQLAVGRGDKEKTCGPIHVFERTQVSLCKASSYTVIMVVAELWELRSAVIFLNCG